MAAADRPLGALATASPFGAGWLLFLGYAVNWLPFIAVERVAFIYHFLPVPGVVRTSMGLDCL